MLLPSGKGAIGCSLSTISSVMANLLSITLMQISKLGICGLAGARLPHVVLSYSACRGQDIQLVLFFLTG